MSKVKSIQNPEEQAVKHFKNTAEEWLVGRKIVKCRYMSDEETKEAGWNDKPLCILLDDGTWIIPQRDDEGNDGGALYLVNPNYSEDRFGNQTTIPVI